MVLEEVQGIAQPVLQARNDVVPAMLVLEDDVLQGDDLPVDDDALAIVPYQPIVMPQQDFFFGRVHVVYGPPLPPKIS